eukprot:s806_g12.t1
MVEDLLRNLGCFREAGSGGSSFGCKTDCVCVGAAGCATREAGSSSSSGPQRSTQQSSQQLEDEAVIFEDEARFIEELGTKTPEELRNLCAGVLRARGEHWMRQRLRGVKNTLMVKLARRVGIRVEVSRQTKLKGTLIDEFMGLLDGLKDSLVMKLARRVGIRVEVSRQTKHKGTLIDELMELLASATDEAVIFEDKIRLNEKLETMTQEELRALCAGVLCTRGEAWMRQRLSGMLHSLVKKAGSATSSGPQRSTQQSSQELREDAIFEDETRLNEMFQTMTVAERLAFCAAVLRARGAEWMRQRLHALTKEPMRNLARKLWICVNPLDKPKGLDRLMDEVMQLLAPSTETKAQQLKEQALQQGDAARSWLSDQLHGMSAKAGKGAKESDLAAVAKEAGLEEIVGLTRGKLVGVIDEGEEVDGAAMEKHLASWELLVKLVAWLRRERLEVIERQHRSRSEMLAQLVEKVSDLLQGYDLVLDGFVSAQRDLDQLVRGNALQFPAGTHRSHVIVLLA